MAIKVIQGFKSDEYLMIKLPNSWLLKLLVRSLLLVVLIASLLWIGSIFGVTLNPKNNVDIIDPHDEVGSDFLLFFFRDLKNEGISRLIDQALFLTDANEDFIYNFHILNNNDMYIVYSKDLKRQDLSNLNSKHTQSPQLQKRLVLSKISSLEAKRAALNELEDVSLEPPWFASRRSRDSLESYPRRVFVDVGLPDNINRKAGRTSGTGMDWFLKHYPMRNLDFQMYKIEIVSEECEGKKVKKNVKEEECVVMKAKAETVEGVVKSKTIRLVDELSLECEPRGKGNRSIRAYWECLSLYRRLRDEGVAAHQWWG
ncbi:hypothetical protein WN943_008149 [Citrus x changshan-huyou]